MPTHLLKALAELLISQRIRLLFIEPHVVPCIEVNQAVVVGAMYGRRQGKAIRNIVCPLGLYWYNMGRLHEIELGPRHRTAVLISIHNLPTKVRRTGIAAYRRDDLLPFLR